MAALCFPTTYDVGSNARSENQILRGLIMASLMLRDQNSEKKSIIFIILWLEFVEEKKIKMHKVKLYS